ncbi:sperm-associated antigen 17 isoform X4 [Gouania willdenowi]|uniref:sperm-associated antigen 17 isoform X4 n=1 Tax=Gouania willdenowi TaxID=441366 RepID=UPI001055CD74|nr:sperm-associated antigen 17 isoform X4 [Gouania willdenowi]
MAPKGNKKGSAKKADSAGAAAVDKNWEAGLIQAPFEEDSWQACVTMVVGKSPVEEDLLPVLASASPQRKLFTSLTWDEIHELKMSKKPDQRPMFSEVTEAVKKLTDAGQEIPCDLIAKLVKFQLLQIKANDQQRRADEQVEAENAAHPPDKGADKKGKKAAKPSKEKKTNLKRRDYVEPPTFIDDEPGDGPQHYILLMGFYQPHLISELNSMGVHVANVIELHSQHIQSFESSEEPDGLKSTKQSPGASSVLDAEETDEGADMLAEQARRLDHFWSGLRPTLESGPPDSKLQDVAHLRFTVSHNLLSFDKQNPEAVCELGRHIFDGVANIIYDCLQWRRQHQHYQNNVKLINIPTIERDLIPEEPSKKKSTTKQHPSNQVAEVSKLSVDVDMTHYRSLLDLVPPETCSVPMILHCMLEQVFVNTSDSQAVSSAECDVVEEPKPSTGPWLSPQVVSDMLQRFLPLIHTQEESNFLINDLLTTVQSEEDKKSLVEKFGGTGSQKTAEEPVVIRHCNKRELRLRDVNAVRGFDPVEVEVSMMRLSSVCELIQSVAQQPNNNSSRMVLNQQLRHYLTDDAVSWSDVEHVLHQSVFEAMPLTTVTEHGLKPPGTPPVLCWDNPLLYAQQQLSDMQTKGFTCLREDSDNTEFNAAVCPQLDVSDIQRCRLRSLFDWHYTEHHDATIFPQVLQAASEEYHCLDTFRSSQNDKLFIFCHNPMTRHRQVKEFWNKTVHTDVRFRKYLEHVAETISDWTREEQEKIDETQIKAQSPTESVKDEIDGPAEEEEESLEPIIRKESLKAWKLEQERLEEEELSKKSKKDKPKSKREKEEDRSTSKKENKAASANSRPQSPTAPPEDVQLPEESLDVPVKAFTGYNMDGKLIHVSGQLQRLYPSDGGQITVETTTFVEGSSLLKIALKKDGHHFFTHINQFVDLVKAVPAPQDDKPADLESTDNERDKVTPVKQGSLSALLDNGIHLSYSSYGPTGECTVNSKETNGEISKDAANDPIPTDQLMETDPQTQQSGDTPPHAQGDTSQAGLASSLIKSLNVSVPNGLLLQFLPEDSQAEEKGVLIRQSFPLHAPREEQRYLHDTSLSKEQSRLITSKGAVIRSMRDGSTEVLFADGSVSFSQDSGPVWVPDIELQKVISGEEAKDGEDQCAGTDAQEERGCWCTTTPSGHRISTVGNTHKLIPTTPLLTIKAVDPITQQVMLSREDLVVSVQNHDGSVCVDHADGTRITSFLRDKCQDTSSHHLLLTGDEQTCCTERPETATHQSASSVTRSVQVDITGETSEQLNIIDEKECSDISEVDIKKETVEENEERSPRESNEMTVANKEQVVLVEKEGYATVVMYPQQHLAHAFLADGTVITGNNQGEYEVFPSSEGLLQIQSDGKCVYTSDLFVASSPGDDSPSNSAGIYTMSHTDKIACEVTDLEGNCFKVMDDGQVSVLNPGSAPRTAQQDEDGLEEEEESDVTNVMNYPRLFIVHKDGSGTELLNSHIVEELLYHAYSDPRIALLKEPLTDTQDEFGITILKPSHQNVWSHWLVDKQSPDITPPNLRNRSWHSFPQVEKKSPGPEFGTNAGRGLNVQLGGSTAQPQPVCSCPKVLEIRELHQHRPLTTPLKDVIDSRLKDFLQILMMRELQSEDMKPKELRTGEERAHASNLLNLILSFTEEDDTSPSVHKTTSVDIASLYSQGIGALTEHSDVSDDTATVASDSLETFKCSSDRKYSKWNERLGEIRWDLSEERMLKEALRKKNVVPFFHPENVNLYEESMLKEAEERMLKEALRKKNVIPIVHPENVNLYKSMQPLQKPDMRSLSPDLTTIKSESEELLLNDVPQESTPRPLNPTPSQSASHAGSRKPEKRSTNPTLQSADKSSVRGSGRSCRSLQVDVTGQPRKTRVRLPAAILSSKPISEPNPQFWAVDQPVRRMCRTVSLADPTVIIRGFELLPSRVDFGTVREGTSSSVTVIMRNVGVDTCRFKVKQPSSITGLRVNYNHGPVAAGLHVELQVQLFAMRALQTGVAEPHTSISEDVIIHTETEILHLPVTANILCNLSQ